MIYFSSERHRNCPAKVSDAGVAMITLYPSGTWALRASASESRRIPCVPESGKRHCKARIGVREKECSFSDE